MERALTAPRALGSYFDVRDDGSMRVSVLVALGDFALYFSLPGERCTCAAWRSLLTATLCRRAAGILVQRFGEQRVALAGAVLLAVAHLICFLAGVVSAVGSAPLLAFVFVLMGQGMHAWCRPAAKQLC